MAIQHGAGQRVGMWERTHVRRSRGMVSGLILVLLGIWGGVIPFVGPLFHFAYTPAVAWHYTTGRLWLEILPGVATVVGGLILMGSASRVATHLAGWLAAAAGAWFVVGQLFSRLWNGGLPAAGVPAGTGVVHVTLEQIAFFYGLGVVIVFFAALALGRTSVIGVADLRDPADDPDLTGGRDDRLESGGRGYRGAGGYRDDTGYRDESAYRDDGTLHDDRTLHDGRTLHEDPAPRNEDRSLRDEDVDRADDESGAFRSHRRR